MLQSRDRDRLAHCSDLYTALSSISLCRYSDINRSLSRALGSLLRCDGAIL
jgi:hypothetical protein